MGPQGQARPKSTNKGITTLTGLTLLTGDLARHINQTPFTNLTSFSNNKNPQS